MCCFTRCSVINVGGGDLAEHKGTEGIIVLHPYPVGIREDRGIQAGDGAVEPWMEATLTSHKGDGAFPLDPISFPEDQSKVRGPKRIFNGALGETDAVGKGSLNESGSDVGLGILSGRGRRGRGGG